VEASVLQGFERALTEVACDRGGLTCAWKEMAADKLLPALNAREIDVMMAAIPANASLGDDIDLTAPYVYPDVFDFIGPPGTDLHGDVKDIATVANATIDEWAKTTPFNIKTFATFDDAWKDLEAGGVNLVMGEREVLVPLLEKHGDQSFTIVLSRKLRPGLAMALHADNIDLRFNFEDRIYDMTQDGSLQDLVTKWFGVDATL
jgi:polar amino acid transport system substrate-binding protein